MNAQRLKITADFGRIVLAADCINAHSAYSRLVGLLNHSALPEGEGLLLNPCNQVHTFFMAFPIDAVFLSRDDKVLAICELKPWRLSKLHWRAKKVLELPPGTCRRLDVRVGQQLEVHPC